PSGCSRKTSRPSKGPSNTSAPTQERTLKTVLIDADVLVYEAALANEKATQWDTNLWTLHAELDPAIIQIDGEIDEIKRQLEAHRCCMCLSDYEDRWRRRVRRTYKSNRKPTRKPIIYEPMRQYLHEAYETFQRPGLEGDDILGILSTNPKLFPGEKVIVS